MEISNESGVHPALSYLIGEKFAQAFFELRKLQNKLKYLYPEKMEEEHPLSVGGRHLKLSYALTLNETYQTLLERIQHEDKNLNLFVREIKAVFPVPQVQDYLNSYPRFRFKQSTIILEEPRDKTEAFMSPEDTFSEAEDILLVEEMKKLFVE
ncbi:MAG: hypothetical protein GWM98_21275 [Nitrospinaceae bacterium]|nr:hypothetical protein [Nitrospinaceae bacterium]NIR56533.1 hypothetical protein [Nitrospinaceae bacterium]NIS86990.1 hypothetical protein [Nitrospinaceae bacterium]NIT83834.1 hypothetical protein [Nitrospinaceae bacterium]NIU46040.1 hypothetical protein [Nitrospinaceae bacterium]